MHSDDVGRQDTDYRGTSRMVNMRTGEELANTVRKTIAQNHVTTEVGALIDPTITHRVISRSPEAVAHERIVERAKRHVLYLARKRRGDYAVPKPSPSAAKVAIRATMVVCPDCEGSGEMFLEGKAVRCPRCGGDAMIPATY